MSGEQAGIAFAVCTAVAFGAGSTVARLGLVRTPIVTGTVVSMLAGTALLLLAASPRYGEALPSIDGGGWTLIVVTSIINYPIGRLLLFTAMRRIGVGGGNTIVSANPVVSGLIAVAWLGETLGALNGAGMAACVGGAALVAWSVREGSASDAAVAEDPKLTETTLGVGAALGAMAAYGTVGALIRKIVTEVTEPMVAASLVFSLGAGWVTLLALPRLRRELREVSLVRGAQLVAGGSGMSLGILLFYNAASKAPITAVAPVVALAPVIAILFSQVIARRFERVDRRVWAGALAVVGGVALISSSLGTN